MGLFNSTDTESDQKLHECTLNTPASSSGVREAVNREISTCYLAKLLPNVTGYCLWTIANYVTRLNSVRNIPHKLSTLFLVNICTFSFLSEKDSCQTDMRGKQS